VASAYTGLGNVYYTRGDLDQAEAMYRKAVELNEALVDKAAMGSNYTGLGIVYGIRGDLDQAEAMYRKALAMFRETGANPPIAEVQRLIDTLR
jgi:Flp pilus assembly protein TadD